MAKAHWTRAYQADRAWLRAQHQPLCARCGRPIRYDLDAPHPLSFSAGHMPGHEVWRHGQHLGRASLQAEHLGCNARDGARQANASRRPPAGPLTSRKW